MARLLKPLAVADGGAFEALLDAFFAAFFAGFLAMVASSMFATLMLHHLASLETAAAPRDKSSLEHPKLRSPFIEIPVIMGQTLPGPS
jgi:hypothetical protein